MSRLSERGRRGLAVPALPLLLLALAGLQAALPLHLHHGTSAGLFNEEHVLAALDSATGDAPLPDPAPGLGIDISRDDGPPAVTEILSGSVSRSSVPRAPPLA